MKRYLAKLKQNSKGVYDISFVNEPAMLGQVVHFSKQEPKENYIQFSAIDEEKRMVIGLVLQPNLDVLRFNEKTKEHYSIYFEEDTIEHLLIEYSKQGHHNNSSTEHFKKVDGITFFEHWIVKDPEVDKSKLYGLNHPKGSWLTMGKVNNDEVWEGVKNGTYKGLSIEGVLDLDLVSLSTENVNIKTEIQMSEIIEANKSVIDAIVELGKDIKALFVTEKKEPVKIEFGSIKSGDLEIMFDGETMAVGGAVWMENEEGEKIMLPANTYEIEGDRKLIVVEEGVIAEIQEGTSKPVEEVPAKMEEVPAPAEPTSKDGDLEKAIKSLLIKYSEEADKRAEEKNKVLLSKIESLEKQVVEFGAKPKAEKIVSKSIDFSKMTNYEKLKYKRANA